MNKRNWLFSHFFIIFFFQVGLLPLSPANAWECDVTIEGSHWVKIGRTIPLEADGQPTGGSYSSTRNQGNLTANGSEAVLKGYKPSFGDYIPVSVTYTSPPGAPSWGKKCSDKKWIYAHCSLSIALDKEKIAPGDTVTATAQTSTEDGEASWSVSRVSGNASATLSPATGKSTTLTNISGEGVLKIRA